MHMDMYASVKLQKALNEGTNTQGGALVPEEFSKKLYELFQTNSVAYPLMEQVMMKYDVLNLPNVTGASTAYKPAENTTITASDPAFARLTLTAVKFAALIEMSSEVVEDSDPSIYDMALRQMSKDVALLVDNEVINGTTTANGFLGLRADTAVNQVNTATNGGEITYDLISDAIAEIQADNHQPTHMLVHARLLNKLRKLKDSQSRPLFDEFTYGSPFLRDGAIGQLLGLRVLVTNQIPVNLTKGSGTSLTDAIILTEKVTGTFGTRRGVQFNRFYEITKDQWKTQVNMRVGYTTVYPSSACVINDLITL